MCVGPIDDVSEGMNVEVFAACAKRTSVRDRRYGLGELAHMQIPSLATG
jgi:hypothetical protein